MSDPLARLRRLCAEVRIGDYLVLYGTVIKQPGNVLAFKHPDLHEHCFYCRMETQNRVVHGSRRGKYAQVAACCDQCLAVAGCLSPKLTESELAEALRNAAVDRFMAAGFAGIREARMRQLLNDLAAGEKIREEILADVIRAAWPRLPDEPPRPADRARARAAIAGPPDGTLARVALAGSPTTDLEALLAEMAELGVDAGGTPRPRGAEVELLADIDRVLRFRTDKGV